MNQATRNVAIDGALTYAERGGGSFAAPLGHALSKDYIPCWTGKTSGDFLPVPEVVAINTSYALPDDQGRLYISMQPVFRHTDAKEVIQLTVTARVLIAEDDNAAMQKAIHIAHEWGVNGFTDFTSSQMHSQWGRRP